MAAIHTGPGDIPQPQQLFAEARPQNENPKHPLAPVKDPAGPANRHVGKLNYLKKGKTLGATGTLFSIGAAFGILCAAHSPLIEIVDGAQILIDQATFVPAYNGGGMAEPYGRITVPRKDMWIPSDFRDPARDDAYDYAVMRVDREQIDQRLLEGLPQLKVPEPPYNTIQVIGFPVGESAMYYSTGDITEVRPPNICDYDASTLGGMSGGPLRRLPHFSQIIGVHGGGVGTQPLNRGVLMNRDMIAVIKEWLERVD